jgi:BirA family biotin operon repressor/biotin-[acetyl-CoA-carboxylase] ligase
VNQNSLAPLSAEAIRAELSTDSQAKLSSIIIKKTTTSTNDVLWQYVNKDSSSPALCLAETQTAGRGRRGDTWQSPASGNLYFSLFWPFAANLSQSGLSIAIGISLINTLKVEGIKDLQLKWPNDVLVNRHKLAGILVESRFGKTQNTIVGVGLNFKLPTQTQKQINQPATSLQQLCSQLPCRNAMAGKIIQNMIETIQLFQHRGLNDFLPLWPQYDAFNNQQIKLIGPDQQFTAHAHGINQQGELRYQRLDSDKIETLSNSHISIRFAS